MGNRLYIALEDKDFGFHEMEVIKFEKLWRKGSTIESIAKDMNRTKMEVVILLLDRAEKGTVLLRGNGLFGKRGLFNAKD